jgi:aldehyde dehydrogenase (NAD+)
LETHSVSESRHPDLARVGKFYIGGEWVDPVSPRWIDVVDPALGEVFTQVAAGGAADIDRAVSAAKSAFGAYSATSREDRLALLRRIVAEYKRRYDDLTIAVMRELGAPRQFAHEQQVFVGLAHLEKAVEVLERYSFGTMRGSTMVVREPIGVAGLITPWNWPLNQIVCKVAPALAVGCTMVLKPSEVTPLNAIIFAEILDEAGVPAGVFNLVQGDGPGAGASLAAHPDVDVLSFTGSTRAGIAVAKASADSVKRVLQELGGKSPNIILEDCDLDQAVTAGVAACFINSGQSCDAATRMLVPRGLQEQAAMIAKSAAEACRLGRPEVDGVDMGPVVSDTQYRKIQRLIEAGIAEGARLVTGGPGHPPGLGEGYFVKPTVFADVLPGMSIAQEEIFGPVLSILPYDTVDDAIAIANDTPYGLAAYISCGDIDRGRQIAGKLRAGSIYLNYPPMDLDAPFGGFRQSGNGREYADFAFDDFTEIKGIIGYAAA